jgi:hypothetical protein
MIFSFLQKNKNQSFAPDCGTTAKWWQATLQIYQNKAGRPCQ